MPTARHCQCCRNASATQLSAPSPSHHCFLQRHATDGRALSAPCPLRQNSLFFGSFKAAAKRGEQGIRTLRASLWQTHAKRWGRSFGGLLLDNGHTPSWTCTSCGGGKRVQGKKLLLSFPHQDDRFAARIPPRWSVHFFFW